MKRFIVTTVLGLGLMSAGGVIAYAAFKSHMIGVKLSTQEAEKKWGVREFDPRLSNSE